MTSVRVTQQLTIALLTVIFCIFALYVYGSLRWHESLYTNDTHRDHHLIGRSLAPAVAAFWSEHDPDRALAFVRNVNEREAGLEVRWIVPDGSRDPEATTSLSSADLRSLAEGREIFRVDPQRPPEGVASLYVPVRVDGRLVGTLEISESLAAQHRYIRSRLLRTATAAALMIALGGALSWFLGNVLVARPIGLLMEKARRIGEGDFGRPIQLARRDEFAELGEALNATAARLASARDRLESETTARIQAIEQLRHADRLSTVGRLAAGIAHELGTPLNVVAERAKMIEVGEFEGTDDLRRNAEIIRRQSQRMTAIIRQLLDLARRRTPQRENTNLGDLARTTTILMQPLFERCAVKLHLSVDDPTLSAFVDSGQIQQVLANLLSNAADASPQGGVVRLVVSRGEGPERPCRIVVEDEGPGIPDHVLPQIFDPFFTTKDVGEGTGLGLAVADGIVREHGGRLDVETGPNGTRFRLELAAT